MERRTLTTAQDTPTTGDNDKLLISNFAAGVEVILEDDATATWAQAHAMGLLAQVGDITVNPEPGVTINGSTNSIVIKAGSPPAVLICDDGADEWTLDGAPFTAVDKLWYGGADGQVLESDLTAFARTILDDADAASARTTLGVPDVIDEDTFATDSATRPPSQQSTKAYIAAEIANVIAAAPGALDTLNELAAAINDDADFHTTVTNQLALKAAITDVVLQSLFDANTIVAANADNTPLALTVAEQRLIGRLTGGNIAALTPAQITTLVDAFTTTLKGAVPASGGGTTNFLRADGTWAAPPDTTDETFPLGTPTADADAEYRIPGCSTVEALATTVVADRAHYEFFYCPRPFRITGYQYNVTTGAGTTARIAVVKMDESDWQPNATGLVGQDASSDPSTSGSKQVSGLAWDCDPGLYAKVVIFDGAPQIRAARCTMSVGPPLNIDTSNVGIDKFFKNSVGTGALSDPVDDWPNASPVSSGNHHMVGLKIEAQP